MTDFTKAFVHNILSNYGDHHWTVQGFGFLRMYFGPHENPKRYRLNLWDSSFTVPGVSTIHDHPWHFTSLIIAGCFCNQRFDMMVLPPVDYSDPNSPLEGGPATHTFTTIRTGEGGGMEQSGIDYCRLTRRKPELYFAGDTYHQDANEVHETLFEDGSVTLNERTPLPDGDHARVFWPYGESWVDAEPRPARPEELTAAITPCLERWF